jgi:SAM-dependent methyltransferase
MVADINWTGEREALARMERITDWLLLWRQIVERQRTVEPLIDGPWSDADDPWRDRAAAFTARANRKWSRPDPLRDVIVSRVTPESTVLDVGAGAGDWTLHLAPHVRRVTALDPSPAMRRTLAGRVDETGTANVDIVVGFWPRTPVEPHDVVLCMHAAYGATDFADYVRRLDETARRGVYMLLKAPIPGGVMSEAAARVWGQPHDSPNLVVAHNALLQLGFLPSAAIDPTPWGIWRSASIEAALADVKRRLAIVDDPTHDEFLRDLLRRRLTRVGEEWVWPASVCSALVYWEK